MGSRVADWLVHASQLLGNGIGRQLRWGSRRALSFGRAKESTWVQERGLTTRCIREEWS